MYMFLNRYASANKVRIVKHISFLIAFVIMLTCCIIVPDRTIVKAEEYVIDYLGASISFEAPRNLRFKFEIAKSDLENIKEYGTLIAKTYDVENTGFFIDSDVKFTKAVAFNSEKGINAVFSRNNNAVQYAVSLNGIEENDYDKLFTVKPYAIYEDGTVVYGEVISQSVYGVAFKAANDTDEEYSTVDRGGFFKIAEDYVVDSENHPINLALGNAESVKVQRATNQKITAIRNAVSDYNASGSIYYVSADGSDSNNGTSQDTPWNSLNKVNAATLKSGDVVLFKRGDVFRGQITLKTGVTYSAYGEGSKPQIYGSPENAAVSSSWSLLEGSDNIWVYKNEIPDVGLIVLNEGENFGLKVDLYYSSTANEFIDADGNTFDIVTALDKNYEFFSECNNVIGSDGYPVLSQSTGNLYMYCDKGNPGDVFDSIEFCCYGNIITGTYTNKVIIDNLCIKYGGSHGVGVGKVIDLTVRNCEIGWIGGSILRYTNGKPVRYGNGVQVHSSANGFYVHDNYIYQIFDAGITHQQDNALETNCEFKDIEYKDNVIERCAWSVEYYMNTPNAGYTHKMSDITISGNIMRLAGSGFGQYRDDEWHYPCHIMSWWSENSGNTNNADGTTFNITNNIFDRSTKSLLEIHAEVESSLPILSANVYIQSVNGAFGRYSLFEKDYTSNQSYCNNRLSVSLDKVAGESDAKLYFTDYKAEISVSVLTQEDYFAENPASEFYAFNVSLANKNTVRYLKVLNNGVRLTETKIASLKNTSVGEPVKIAFFSDTHFVGELTEQEKTKQHLVDLYELRKDTFRNTVRSTPASLAFGDLFDRTVIGGDLFDFYSEGNINLFKSTVTDNYPNVLTLLGNHEGSEGFSGITPEVPTALSDIYADLNERVFGYGAIKTEGTINSLEQAEEYNDIYLAHNLVKDSSGNEKALLLMMDNQNYTYQFTDFHYNRLKFYIDYAKDNKIPVLIFQHTPLCTGRTTEIVSPYDIIVNGNGKGENWGTSASTALAGAPYHDSKNPMTTQVYDLIVNNADVVKGFFCGHVHNNIYTEIVAKTSGGVDTVIPQYTIAGNYFYSNINLITVE